VSQLSYEEEQAQLDAEYKTRSDALKANHKLRQESEAAIKPAFETLTKYAEFITDEQKKQVASIFGLSWKATAKRAKGASSKSSGEKLPPKFQIPSGATNVGRGAISKEFKAWAESAEGKKWRKDNPGQDWPAYPYKAK